MAPQNYHVRKRAGFELALERQGHWSWGCRAGSDLRSPQGAYLCDMQLIAYLGVEIKFDVPPCVILFAPLGWGAVEYPAGI